MAPASVLAAFAAWCLAAAVRCSAAEFVSLELGRAGTSVSKDCVSASECRETRWCWSDPRRPLLSPRGAWSPVVVTVTWHGAGRSEGEVCLVGESSDSWLRMDTIRGLGVKGAVKDRINRVSHDDATPIGVVSKVFELVLQSAMCKKELQFSPFGETCVRLARVPEVGNATVTVSHRKVQVKYAQWIMLGFALLAAAPILSNQLPFYYVSGVLLCVAFSVFVATNFVLRKATGRRSWTLWVAIFFQSAFGWVAVGQDMLQNLFEAHSDYVIAYLAVSGLAGFALTHYVLRGNGPDAGPSTGLKDLVRWGIQALGYWCLFMGSASVQVSGAIVTAVIWYRVLLPTIGERYRSVRYWLDPNWDVVRLKEPYIARPFLTAEEYAEETIACTESAQQKLFGSPEFRAWMVQNMDRIRVLPPTDSESAQE